jgi:DnaJ-class molecular chaperone
MEDYYKTLGVNKSATEAEIKSAYRKLAREWHPDVAKEKPNAEAKFKEINEAYQVLSDKQKRSQYDQFGHAAFGKGSNHNTGSQGFAGGFDPFSGGGFHWSTNGAQGDFGNIDPFDIFEQVFGFRGFGGQRKARSYSYEIQINFEDSIKGFEKTIDINGKKLKVKIPPGVDSGTQIKYEGHGEKPSRDGMLPGDLYVIIHVKPHKEMQREGFNTFGEQTISIAEAALGTKIDIKTVDPKSETGFSTKQLKIPEGTQPNTQFRLRGYGMPHPKGYGRGDHYVLIKVEIPKKLNKEQKQALKELF